MLFLVCWILDCTTHPAWPCIPCSLLCLDAWAWWLGVWPTADGTARSWLGRGTSSHRFASYAIPRTCTCRPPWYRWFREWTCFKTNIRIIIITAFGIRWHTFFTCNLQFRRVQVFHSNQAPTHIIRGSETTTLKGYYSQLTVGELVRE